MCGMVVLLLKPANLEESYRPITLFSLLGKTLEVFLLPTIIHHLSLAEHQPDSRKVYSTTTALSVINAQIARLKRWTMNYRSVR